MKPERHTTTPSARIKRIGEATAYVGLSRSTVYRLLKLGQFPTPLRLSENSVGWDTSSLDDWLDAKATEQSAH
jgi:prophage regulatory protein